MFKIAAAAAVVATFVSAQPPNEPPQPVWPLEFFAEIDERDLAHGNRSTLYRQAYSYENDAQKNIFHTLDNSTFVAFDDFRERVTYLLVGTSPTDAKCQTRPSFGELFVPPVASFRFRAIETCTWCPTPIQIQTWEGRTRTAGDFFYHTTNDAVQAPVGFFDLDRKIANVFLEFEAIKGGQWPARVWEKPVECQ